MFEDEKEAADYCDLLEGGGQGCEGVAEIVASSVRNAAMITSPVLPHYTMLSNSVTFSTGT